MATSMAHDSESRSEKIVLAAGPCDPLSSPVSEPCAFFVAVVVVVVVVVIVVVDVESPANLAVYVRPAIVTRTKSRRTVSSTTGIHVCSMVASTIMFATASADPSAHTTSVAGGTPWDASKSDTAWWMRPITDLPPKCKSDRGILSNRNTTADLCTVVVVERVVVAVCVVAVVV
jgi:hypothetical protein